MSLNYANVIQTIRFQNETVYFSYDVYVIAAIYPGNPIVALAIRCIKNSFGSYLNTLYHL